MRRRISLIALLLLGSISSTSVAQASTLQGYTGDPANGGVGFQRAHWATSINKWVIPFGSMSEHSVRALDPVTNTWEILWPKDGGGPQSRDGIAGGLVGRSQGRLMQSYALGAVSVAQSTAGGFAGSYFNASKSFAAGRVHGGSGSILGGFTASGSIGITFANFGDPA